MNNGVSFKIPNAYGSFLNDILNGVDIGKCTWKVSEDEVLFSEAEDLFTSEIVEGPAFARLIALPSYYMIFLNLQAFTDPGNVIPIETYGDFVRGDCKILILVCDNIFVDVYAKERGDIETIKENARKCNFSEMRDITDLSEEKVLNAR